MAFVSVRKNILNVFVHVPGEAPTAVEEHRQRRHRTVVLLPVISVELLPLPVLDFLIADLEMVSKTNTWLTAGRWG